MIVEWLLFLCTHFQCSENVFYRSLQLFQACMCGWSQERDWFLVAECCILVAFKYEDGNHEGREESEETEEEARKHQTQEERGETPTPASVSNILTHISELHQERPAVTTQDIIQLELQILLFIRFQLCCPTPREWMHCMWETMGPILSDRERGLCRSSPEAALLRAWMSFLFSFANLLLELATLEEFSFLTETPPSMLAVGALVAAGELMKQLPPDWYAHVFDECTVSPFRKQELVPAFLDLWCDHCAFYGSQCEYKARSLRERLSSFAQLTQKLCRTWDRILLPHGYRWGGGNASCARERPSSKQGSAPPAFPKDRFFGFTLKRFLVPFQILLDSQDDKVDAGSTQGHGRNSKENDKNRRRRILGVIEPNHSFAKEILHGCPFVEWTGERRGEGVGEGKKEKREEKEMLVTNRESISRSLAFLCSSRICPSEHPFSSSSFPSPVCLEKGTHDSDGTRDVSHNGLCSPPLPAPPSGAAKKNETTIRAGPPPSSLHSQRHPESEHDRSL